MTLWRAVALDRLRDDRGSSVAEFAMIVVLLVFLLFAVLQVAAFFYVRSVAAAAASDGARWAANADVDSASGAQRASQVLSRGLGRRLSSAITCAGGQSTDPGSDLATAQVRCSGHLRSVFLPLGGLMDIDVRGESLEESGG